MRRHADSAETCCYKDTVMKYLCVGASACRLMQALTLACDWDRRKTHRDDHGCRGIPREHE